MLNLLTLHDDINMTAILSSQKTKINKHRMNLFHSMEAEWSGKVTE